MYTNGQYATLSGDPYQRTEEALEADPACVMAHCLGGLLTALGHSNPELVAACLARAESELAAGVVREGGGEGGRERAFAATLRAWAGGRWREVR